MTNKTDTIIQLNQGLEIAIPDNMKVETDQVRTPGWKLFDLLVHGGINGVLNIAASVWMAKDRSNHNINKLIDGKNSNVYSDEIDVSKAKRRKVVLDKVPLVGNFYEFSDWLDSQFYNKDAHGNIKTSEETFGKGFSEKYSNNQAKGGIFGRLEDGALGKVPVIKQLIRPLGKYTGGILFLSWGGHVTNAVMSIFESKAIKPKLVRFLDKVIDGSRSTFGKQRTAEELAVRTEIYKKLDSDLAGKTMKGIWGARFAGIATVITVAAAAEATDEAISGRFNEDGTEKQLGILRASQGFFKASRFTEAGRNKLRERAGKDPKHWEFLKEDTKSLKSAEARYIADQTATEFMGTGITTATQYVYLMMRELFGVGPKTNVGDKKKPKIQILENKTTPNRRDQQETIAESKTQDSKIQKQEDKIEGEDRKTKNYSEQNKPAGKNYQDRAVVKQNESEVGQVI